MGKGIASKAGGNGNFSNKNAVGGGGKSAAGKAGGKAPKPNKSKGK